MFPLTLKTISYQTGSRELEEDEEILFKINIKDIIFHFFTLPLEIPDKTKLPPGNPTKLCQIPWKFRDQKSRPPGNFTLFFLATLSNFTSFLINPRKLHMLYLWYHWNFHILNPPPPPPALSYPCLVFFLD